MLQKSATLEFVEGPTQLFGAVHDDGTMPGDGLAKWLS